MSELPVLVETDDIVHHPLHPDHPGQHLFLTDLDGVLFDWGGDFKRWLETHRNLEVSGEIDMHRKIEDQINLDFATTVSWIEEFQISEHAGNLTVYPDALQWLPKIAQEFDFKFIGVTTAGTHPQIVERRAEVLNAHFPKLFEAVVVLPPITSKAKALALFEDARYWVDDSHRHVEAGLDNDIYSFHMIRDDTPHRGADLHEVSSWSVIYAHLLRVHSGKSL